MEGCMKSLAGVAAALVLLSPSAVRAADPVSVEALVAQAVLPLPEDLRAGATVLTYDPSTGARKVLRQGTNTIECQPKNPADGFPRCYSNVLAPRRDLEAKLRAEKKTDKEVQEAVGAAIKARTPKKPPFATQPDPA